MTDKNLTDTEIIKALECCYSKGNWCGSGCPRMYCCDTVTECRMELNKDALNLIDRLRAEIEKRDRAFEELIKVARLWKEKYNNLKDLVVKND